MLAFISCVAMLICAVFIGVLKANGLLLYAKDRDEITLRVYPIELSPDATVQQLVDEIATIAHLPADRIVISLDAQHVLDQDDVSTSLADTGISNEQTVYFHYQQPKIVVVMGSTQVGKTSFIQSITNCTPQEIETGIAMATARFGMDRYAFFDCDHLDDMRFRWSDEEILQSLKRSIASTLGITLHRIKPRVDAFVLCEDLSYSTVHIMHSLMRLQEIFGMNVSDSVIVAGFQGARAEDRRVRCVTHICERQGVAFVEYESRGRDHRGREGRGPIAFDAHGAQALLAAIGRVNSSLLF